VTAKRQKRISNYNPQGKRRIGNGGGRWTDVVNSDTRKAGVGNWRKEAKDRG
jgi:hypothetical protein